MDAGRKAGPGQDRGSIRKLQLPSGRAESTAASLTPHEPGGWAGTGSGPLIHGTVQSQPASEAGTSLKLDKPWRMLSQPTLPSWPGVGLLTWGQACSRQGFHSSARLCRAGNSRITNPLHQTEHLHECRLGRAGFYRNGLFSKASSGSC